MSLRYFIHVIVCISLWNSRAVFLKMSSHVELISSNYSDVVESKAFVDKTLLLKELFAAGDSYLLITAPRKFGRSTNLDMIRLFASYPQDENGNRLMANTTVAYRVFKELLIFSDIVTCNKHFASYPVVVVDLKADRTINSYNKALEAARDRIHRCYLEHSYLSHSQALTEEQKNMYRTWSEVTEYIDLLDSDIFAGIRHLVKMVYTHYNKTVILLVDNYDSYVTQSMYRVKPSELDDITSLVIRMINGLFNYVSHEVITGELYLQGNPLHNFKHFKICKFMYNHSFVEYFGFMEWEVEYLFQHFQTTFKKEDFDAARLRYHGYTSKSNHTIFTPYSILRFLDSGKEANYWAKTGDVEYLLEAMKDTYLRLKFEQVMGFTTIVVKEYYGFTLLHLMYLRNLYTGALPCLEPDVVFAHLLERGYLSLDNTDDEPPGKHRLRITSIEVQESLLESIFTIFRHDNPLMAKDILDNITLIANLTYLKLN